MRSIFTVFLQISYWAHESALCRTRPSKHTAFLNSVLSSIVQKYLNISLSPSVLLFERYIPVTWILNCYQVALPHLNQQSHADLPCVRIQLLAGLVGHFQHLRVSTALCLQAPHLPGVARGYSRFCLRQTCIHADCGH